MADIGKIIPATPEPALAPSRFPAEPNAEAVGEFARSVREKDEPLLRPASFSFGNQNDQAAATGEPAAGRAGNISRVQPAVTGEAAGSGRPAAGQAENISRVQPAVTGEAAGSERPAASPVEPFRSPADGLKYPGKERPGTQGPQDEKTTENAGGKNTVPLHGDALLAGMQSPPSYAVAQTHTPGPVASAAPRPDGNLLAKLAGILVSAADAKGGAEVRIAVRDEVLPGTEVHIRREAGGELSIRFVTQDVVAERMLSPDRLDVLRQTLAGTLQSEVRVTVSSPDGGLTAEADSRGDRENDRSGQGDQPRDGRSRQHGIFEADQDDV